MEGLRRSKSMCSLSDDAVFHKIQTLHKKRSLCGYGYQSGSSEEVFVANDSDSEASERGKVLVSLEQKIDRLSDLFLEQCRLLSSIKDEIEDSKDTVEKTGIVHNQLPVENVNKTISQRVKELSSGEADDGERDSNSRARSLLDALEVKRSYSLDHDVREALTTFLQSDELRSRVATLTSASVRDVVPGCVSRVYLPVLERSHRRLLRHVTRTLEDAFAELEENSSQLSKQMFRASRNLRRTLERQLGLLDAPTQTKYANSLRHTVEELLDKELKQWRQKMLDVISAELQPEPDLEPLSPPLKYPAGPASPPQPVDPENSIIDQLMKSAEINKQICDGDVNGSFEKALSAADLSLVTAVCRAVDPAVLFAPPCVLTQSVLLSLTQQLVTDMVQDTQLKCRYLEDAIINLNTASPVTRTHLPVVVGEVRKHLMKFLLLYPNHVASRRVTLIVMAADDLLKRCT